MTPDHASLDTGRLCIYNIYYTPPHTRVRDEDSGRVVHHASIRKHGIKHLPPCMRIQSGQRVVQLQATPVVLFVRNVIYKWLSVLSVRDVMLSGLVFYP